jgi:mono/diheme cytochrome c family protein
MTRWQIPALAASLLLCNQAILAQTAPATPDSRGELLYSNHCVACHSTQIHWRDNKLATDWATLNAQVRRWSSNTGAAWGEEDILLVTRYLNAAYYHYPGAAEKMSGSPSRQGMTALNACRRPFA